MTPRRSHNEYNSSANQAYASSRENFSGQEDELDLKRLFQIFLIHKWKFFIILSLVVLLSYLYYLRQPVIYKSEFEIFYNQSIPGYSSNTSLPANTSAFDKNYWLSLMKSDEIARLTVQNSGLSLSVDEIRGLISVEIKSSREINTPIFLLTITSKRNEHIPVILVAYVKSLNDLLLKSEIGNSQKMVDFLNSQLAEHYEKLQNIDKEILYNQSNPYLIRDITTLSANLESYRTSLLNTQIDLTSITSSRKRAESELKKLSGTIVNESAFSEPLKVQLMNLQVDLARALTRNKDSHPSVIAIRDNINQITHMLHDSIEQKLEIKNLITNPIKSELMSKLLDFKIKEISLEAREKSLLKVIAELESQMLPDTSDFNQQQLTRNRELLVLTISELNSNLIGIQSASQGSLDRFVIIDDPQVPLSPTNKALTYFLLLGFFAGAVLAAGAVFVYDLLDNRIMLVSDFSKFYNIPILGCLPHSKNLEKSYMELANNKDSYRRKSETAEIILSLKELLKNSDKKIVSISSPVRKEGKSIVSLQLAMDLAAKNLNVLLVDMDFYAPKLTSRLNLKEHINLRDYLTGNATEEQVVASTGINRLSFVSAGLIKDNSEANYENPGYFKFLSWAKANYDIVLLDTPALLFVPDMISFLEHVDAILLVARLSHTTRISFDKMLSLLSFVQHKIHGVIINDLQKTMLNHYGEYYYYYTYEYGNVKEKTRRKRSKTKTHSPNPENLSPPPEIIHESQALP
jgi:capsular exopolysaccharide synthesis family protein